MSVPLSLDGEGVVFWSTSLSQMFISAISQEQVLKCLSDLHLIIVTSRRTDRDKSLVHNKIKWIKYMFYI